MDSTIDYRAYSVDSIKRTVHLAFHRLFFLIFQKISIKNTVYT